MRLARLFTTGAVASVAALAFATPAAADDHNAQIKDTQVPTTAADFETIECKAPFEVGQEEDGWHFILPSSQGTGFTKLTLTFDEGGPAVITSTDSGTQSSGDGWHGYIDNAGDSDKHAYLWTTAGWTLNGGTATVTDPAGDITVEFNLSHTCAGTPDESKSPSTSPSSSRSPGGDLPKTGSALTGLIGAGVIALVGGAALLAVRRRRNLTEV